MLLFYKGLNRDGQRSYGILNATSRFQALRSMLLAGKLPKHLYTLGDVFHRPFFFSNKNTRTMTLPMWVTLLDRIVLVMQSGRTLMESLTSVATIGLKEPQSHFIQETIQKLRSGLFFYEVLQQQTSFLIQERHAKLIQCAEMGGYLKSGLSCYLDQLKVGVHIRQRILYNLLYPALVLLMAIGALLTLSYFVLPEFKTFLVLQGIELSWFLRFIFSTGEWIILLLPGSLIGSLCIYSIFRKTINTWILQFVLPHLPKFNTFLKPLQLGLFAMNFSALLKNGVYLLESLRLSATCLTQKLFEAEQVIQNLKNGIALSTALAELPDFFLEALKSAELSGNLPAVLDNLSQHYLHLYNNRLNQLAKWVEPTCLILIALFMIILILSLFTPITHILQNFNFD